MTLIATYMFFWLLLLGKLLHPALSPDFLIELPLDEAAEVLGRCWRVFCASFIVSLLETCFPFLTCGGRFSQLSTGQTCSVPQTTSPH
jgi:hypothetical protein